MPYYSVTGPSTADMTISPLNPMRRTERREELGMLESERYEQFRNEIDQANAIFQARISDLRPAQGETVEGLRSQIIQPVLEKWRMVPGFGGAASVQVEQMRQYDDAKQAADQALQHQRMIRRRDELMKGGVPQAQATMTAVLETNFRPQQGMADLVRAVEPAPAPATRYSQVEVTGEEPEYRGFKPGVYSVGSDKSAQYLRPAPRRDTITGAKKYRLDKLTGELEDMTRQQRLDEVMVANSKNPNGAGTKKKAADIVRRAESIRTISDQIEELLGGDEPARKPIQSKGNPLAPGTNTVRAVVRDASGKMVFK